MRTERYIVMLTMSSDTIQEKGVVSPVTVKGYHKGREPANKGKKFPAEVLAPDEAKALIRSASNRAPTGIRNRALITVLYRGGLRLGEVLALRPKDIDGDEGTITVLRGKADRRRVVAIDPEAMAVVMRWLDRHRALGISGRRTLFCTLQGRPLQPSYVRTMLARLAGREGIDKRVHPHGLRHTMAYELMMEGVPIPIIQKQLGHASLATTERYLQHIAPKDLIEAMTNREWRLGDE